MRTMYTMKRNVKNNGFLPTKQKTWIGSSASPRGYKLSMGEMWNLAPLVSCQMFPQRTVFHCTWLICGCGWTVPWWYATCTSPIMHLICPPKLCISIVFNFSWDGCNTTQEKRKTNKVHYGRCASGVFFIFMKSHRTTTHEVKSKKTMINKIYA